MHIISHSGFGDKFWGFLRYECLFSSRLCSCLSCNLKKTILYGQVFLGECVSLFEGSSLGDHRLIFAAGFGM